MDEFPCSVMAGVRVVAFWRGGGGGICPSKLVRCTASTRPKADFSEISHTEASSGRSRKRTRSQNAAEQHSGTQKHRWGAETIHMSSSGLPPAAAAALGMCHMGCDLWVRRRTHWENKTKARMMTELPYQAYLCLAGTPLFFFLYC